MTHHWTARRGIGFSEILSCGESYWDVAREAVKKERHPVMVEILPGAACARCGYTKPDPVVEAC